MLKFIKDNSYSMIICILLTVSSCNKEEQKSPNSAQINTLEIMPLKVGNEWVYKVTDYEVSGQIEDQKEEIWTVVKDTVISNEKVFYTNEGFSYLNRNDGLYTYDSTDSTYTKFVKYPGIVGESFTTFSGERSTIISTNKMVTGPAGTFNCYQYSTIISSLLTEVIYFSPGSGLIKAEAIRKDSIQKTYLHKSWELTKLSLK